MAFTYEWDRCLDLEVLACQFAGVGPRYLLTTADNGYRIRLRTTAKNVDAQATATSTAVGAVRAPILYSYTPWNESPPVISGYAQLGEVLDVSEGLWREALVDGVYTYKWYRCSFSGCYAVPGATSSQYVPTVPDLGYRLFAEVQVHSATATGESAPAVSLTTDAVVGDSPCGSNDARSPSRVATPVAATTAPITVASPGTLTVTPGVWNPCGAAISRYGYQWYRASTNGVVFPVADAVEPEYPLTDADAGLKLFAEVTAYNSYGPSAPTRSNSVDGPSDTSSPTCQVGPPVVRYNPVLQGTPKVYNTLTTTNGTWWSCGSALAGYSYDWLRNGVVFGPHSQSYTPLEDSANQSMRTQVTAWNADGPSSPADSNEVTILPPDANTTVCNDGIDNDGDGLIDYPNDPGCSSPSDTDETDEVVDPVIQGCGGSLEDDTCGGTTAKQYRNFGGRVIDQRGRAQSNRTIRGIRSGIAASANFTLGRQSFALMRVSAESGGYLIQAGLGHTRDFDLGDCSNSEMSKTRPVRYTETLGPPRGSGLQECVTAGLVDFYKSDQYTVYLRSGTQTWAAYIKAQFQTDRPLFGAAALALASGEIGSTRANTSAEPSPRGKVMSCFACSATDQTDGTWEWTETAGSTGWKPANPSASDFQGYNAGANTSPWAVAHPSNTPPQAFSVSRTCPAPPGCK